VSVTPPEAVLAAWGWQDDAGVEPLTGGLINSTFVVRRAGQPIAALQRLHPVFAPEVNLDLEAVTAHLAARGLTTPLLVRTDGGQAWVVDEDGRPWRALTWLDGVTLHAVPAADVARAGGELVGRFHRAVADLEHDSAFVRAGVHDTAAHLARLAERVATPAAAAADGEHADRADDRAPAADDRAPDADIDVASDLELRAEAIELGHAIAGAARELPPMPALPRRHTHGDLKISNLLFAPLAGAAATASATATAAVPTRGLALLDLDTLGRQPLAFELGDALRSWCNPRGEDAGTIAFDLAIFAAAIDGWADVAGALFSPAERRSIVAGLETVCVELAARFCVDVFDDRYFGWDPVRFPSRRAHNLVRARGQLALAAAVRAVRDDALAIVAGDHPRAHG
jgi:Ser/Thr protein kinase RdoA (MazF antagonist)